VSWLKLPRLDASACKQTQADLIEHEHRLSPAARTTLASWLLRMQAWDLIRTRTLARALAHRYPATALGRLYFTTRNRLAKRLNALYASHFPNNTAPADEQELFTVSLSSPSEYSPPNVIVKMHSYLGVSVDSLRRLPARLAGLVHESFSLIDICMLPHSLPLNIWNKDPLWFFEMVEAEYHKLKKVGGLSNVPGMEELARMNQLEFLSPEGDGVEEDFRYVQQVIEGRPRWMREVDRTQPLRRARELKNAAHQYGCEYGPHPWVDYVQEVCTTLLGLFANDKVWQHYTASYQRASTEGWDDELHVSRGVWLLTRSPIERRHIDEIHEDFMQYGGDQVLRFRLTRIADERLRSILEAFAHGAGLLRRAADIDLQLTYPRIHSSGK
jgi:hypothetical protein